MVNATRSDHVQELAYNSDQRAITMYRCSGTPMRGRATLIYYITLVSAAASLTGCEDDAIQAYAVPKDPIPVVQAQTPEPHADLRQLID